MKISVIIPTCNRNDMLELCLGQLLPQVIEFNNTADSCELIVTDDGNINSAEKLVVEKYAPARWSKGPGRGPAANRNHGAGLAKGEWLIFIDDDCVPDERLLQEYWNAIQLNKDSRAFEGAILPDDKELLNKDMAECPVNEKGGVFWSANICIEKKLFHQIKGFDETFLLAAQEDQDIYIRVQQNTIVPFIPKATVIHPVRKVQLSKKIKNIDKELKNWLLFVTKHTPGEVPLQIRKGMFMHMRLIPKRILQLRFREVVYHAFVLVKMLPIVAKGKA
ncbi:MAG: glycosyltransferase family A protein [Chitinophagaceae bacterium]